MMDTVVHVVAAVIYSVSGQILIAKRASHRHQGGLWEFPGGKREPGEEPAAALTRELQEELGITPIAIEPLIQILHHYPDKSVLLDVWKVLDFVGEERGLEGQPLLWVDPQDLPQYDFPAANAPILKAVALPDTLAITGHANSTRDWLNRLQQAIYRGAGAVQLRSASLPADQLLALMPEAQAICTDHGVPLILNSRLAPLKLLLELPVDGIHFSRRTLAGITERPIPPTQLLSFACHSAQDFELAEKLQADFALLSPVLLTSSHPDAIPLGWPTFAYLCQSAKMPVFALGGLNREHLPQAKAAGAQGVAGISGLWPAE